MIGENLIFFVQSYREAPNMQARFELFMERFREEPAMSPIAQRFMAGNYDYNTDSPEATDIDKKFEVWCDWMDMYCEAQFHRG